MEQFRNYPGHLALVLLLSLLAGCGGGADPVIPNALTEHDFAAGTSLRLEASSVGVTFLEPMDALPETSDDTGLPGTDVIRLQIEESTTSTYAIDLADDTIAMVKLIKMPGNEEVFALNASQPTATVTLEPGAYDLVVYSGYTMAEASGETQRAVFLHESTPTPTPTTSLKVGVSHTSALVANPFVWFLIKTNSCVLCSLRGVDLTNVNLNGAILTGADLSYSRLGSAKLSGANLRGANLGSANLMLANLRGANLRGANLSRSALFKADMSGADLSGADLSYVNISEAKFISANLSGANLSNSELASANLSGANLSGANLTDTRMNLTIWTDERVCAIGSVGTCN